ncbi:beta-galactosidase [Anaerocolumna sp. AGMB13020]|uniref:beta-galactosidase n=1 Tax=Anaerocolumna sp. AGMB13020 TaxID=3081750 RepID=UPI002954B1F6|nr:beta-galactosidase [Anaerocolumna sp. AGMB13020]WOO37185.1 beta-galactosidase [Anaerocolumna sp. AGMB13020]
MDNLKNSFVLFGGDYNPDQWDEATIDRDMELFAKAGVNTVTLPVFSWAKLEPEEGVYQFEWLDKILDKLWNNGIRVILATPTCAQPAWMSRKYPEVLPVDIAGRKRTHGMRVFFCVNSEKYRERAAAMATAMAERYKSYQGLLGWHVANEYGTYCYCDNCQKKFRSWLKKRYQTIENLNDKWTTSFWGRTLTSFEEIMLPTELNDDYRFNPAIQLDYMRFVTASTIDCYNNEARILKKATPNLPVFSNISGYIKKLNQFEMVPQMDYAGWDNYPAPGDERSFPALKHNIMRASKDGKSFLVVEQSPNQQNWQPYNKLKRPGEIRKIAYQGLAHGSDSCLYFQLRQSVGGQEKFHGAFVSHNGSEDTRIFKECAKLGQELKKLDNTFVNARTQSKAGIIFDWDNWWSLELTSGPTKDMNYLEQVHYYYKPFYYQNVPVDIIKQSTDFSNYKVIVAPLLYMTKEGVAERLEQFVKAGGTLIATYMSGYVDENDRCIFGAYPGLLREVLGVWVEEVDALYPMEKNTIKMTGNKINSQEYMCSFLCDVLHSNGAEVLAAYSSDFYEGMPAVTVNRYGAGKAYYLGTQIEETYLNRLIEEICENEKLSSEFEFAGDMEITSRTNENGKFIFVINHGTQTGVIDLKTAKYKNLLDDKCYSGKIQIAPSDVLILA